jgi:hypothetical protein
VIVDEQPTAPGDDPVLAKALEVLGTTSAGTP